VVVNRGRLLGRFRPTLGMQLNVLRGLSRAALIGVATMFSLRKLLVLHDSTLFRLVGGTIYYLG